MQERKYLHKTMQKASKQFTRNTWFPSRPEPVLTQTSASDLRRLTATRRNALQQRDPRYSRHTFFFTFNDDQLIFLLGELWLES